MFLFEKIDKNVKFNSLFLENSEKILFGPRKAGGFIIWGWKFYPSEPVSSLRFFTLEMGGRKKM